MRHTPAIALPLLLGLLLFLGGGVFLTIFALVTVCASIWLWRVSAKPETTTDIRYVNAAYLALLTFFMLHLLPLPLLLTRLTGPARFMQNAAAADILSAAAAKGTIPKMACWFSMTRDLAGTLRLLLLMTLAYATTMLAARATGAQRITIIRIICVLGTATAIAGVTSQRITPQGSTLWWLFDVTSGKSGPVAGFINRNHYAGLLAVLSPCALALFIGDLKARRPILAALSLLMSTVMIIGTLMSHSRGGAVALIAGIMAVPVFLIFRKHVLYAILAMVLIGAISCAAFRILPPGVHRRLGTLAAATKTGSFDTRYTAWNETLRIWRQYPIMGAGPNAFRTVYPQHRTTSRRSHMTHAENEYLQVLADAGIVGAGLTIFLGLAFFLTLRRARSQDTQNRLAIQLLAFSGFVAALVHAGIDFALHLPVYAMTAAILAGISIPDTKPERPNTDMPVVPCPRLLTVRMTSTISAAVAIIASLALIPLGHLNFPKQLMQASPVTLARALRSAPTFATAWHRFGLMHSRGTNPDASIAASCFTTAGTYDPNSYKLWLSIGRQRMALEDYTGARNAFARARELRFWVSIPDIPEETP